MSFTGFAPAALRFYRDLDADNSKDFWTANKAVYEEQVRAPFEELLAELAEEFGDAKLFRPYRDVRFSKDKRPYKTEIAAVVHRVHAAYYLHLHADGLAAGGGARELDSTALANFREAVADTRRGSALERALATATEAGLEVGGDQLKTAPRGYGAEHPRIELLRYKGIFVFRELAPKALTKPSEVVDWMRATWTASTPLLDWLDRHLG